MGGAMIVTRGLTKRYGDFVALDSVDLRVSTGESVALWGPNGAGKTTVVRCILGLSSYDGQIEVAGMDAACQPKRVRSLIGHVPQELAFYNDQTVIEAADFSARLKRVDTDTVEATLELVGVTSHAYKPIGSLSGGLKQRLAIGLALLGNPPILLLDEPTSNLDAGSRESVVSLLHDLKSPERSMVLTSHHIEEIGLLADRVIVFETGRVVLECGPHELSERMGLRSWLHVRISAGTLDEAALALSARGIRAWPNRQGVLVEVPSQRKGDALRAFDDAGYPVVDFEVWR